MKKSLFLLLLVLLLVVGCGSDKQETEKKDDKGSNPVDSYVLNSKKSAWIDTAVVYAKSVVNKVNEAGKLRFFTENVLYMVPVGNDNNKSCISLESNLKSPFSDSWNYAYVGVVYTGTGYEYYFVGEDGEKNGILFVTQMFLNNEGFDTLYLDGDRRDSEISNYLIDKYNLKSNEEITVSDIEKKMISNANSIPNVKKVVYIAAPSCTYN